MKIVYLVNQYPSETHTFIRREIQALEKLGYEVLRISVRPTEYDFVDAIDNAEKAKTVSLLSQGKAEILLSTFRTFLQKPIQFCKTLFFVLKIGAGSDRGILINLFYLFEACLLLEICKAHQIQHIHAHFGTNSTTVAMLCKLLGGPSYSFTSHGPEEYDKARAISLPEKIQHASFVAGISSFGRSQLYRYCSVEEWDKIIIVHCGVDADSLPSESEAIPDTSNLVCIGRLCEQKGQELLIKAVAKVIGDGIPMHLTLVGDGEMRPQVEKLIRSLEINEHVKVTGWANSQRVQEELLNARGMVLPSFAEGLPVVIMEAFALGRPVISTYVAGIPELVIQNHNGWLCPASDIDALVKAVKELLQTDVKTLTEMGLHGKELVMQNHDVNKEAKVLDKAIQSSVNSTMSN